jgi:monothiol glutaredoxin
MSTKEKILQQLAENPVIIYMKGIPSAPECGFSAKACAILDETKIPYTYVNVMKAPFIRERLPSVSKWPTFPQLFINGELIGGSDIVEAIYEDGSLVPLLQAAAQNKKPMPDSNTISHKEVESLITKDFPDAHILIEGQGCDLTITVISEKFDGLSMVKQHQGVMVTLREALASGRLHAVTLNTFTTGQWQSKQEAKSGLLQIQL